MSDEMVSGWRVATYTGGQGNCVEVGRSAAAVAVRDTKDENGSSAALRSVRVARVHGASQRIVLSGELPPFGRLKSPSGSLRACRLA